MKESGRTVKYFGESSRTGYDRGLEHQRALANRDEESPLVEHMMNAHPGIQELDNGQFEMKVKSVHPGPLQRQCEEAHMIQTFSGDTILNRKGEWGQNLPPRLSIEDETYTAGAHTKRKRRGIIQTQSEEPLDHQVRPQKKQKLEQDDHSDQQSKSHHMKAGQILQYMHIMRTTLKANRVQETSDQQGEQSQDCSNENERINMHQLEPIQRVIPVLLREELETKDLGEIKDTK